MKIRIIKIIPVRVAFGLTVGEIVQTIKPPPERHHQETWVLGKNGQPVRLLPHEYERVIEEDKGDRNGIAGHRDE
ncbi:MAG: hypothetical protein PHS60_02160 [Zavarzinia sp.]|nr:hypothetical protein [Zavarzinia sp.]